MNLGNYKGIFGSAPLAESILLSTNLFDNLEMIPLYAPLDKFITMEFKGFAPFAMSHDDEVFSRTVNFLSQVLRSFVAVHMDSFAFTEPELIMTTDGIFRISIGIRNKKDEKNNT